MTNPDPIYGIVPLREVEREHIQRAVARTKSMTRAAKLLGIGRTTLHRKLGEYGYKPGSYTPPVAK